MDSKHYQQTTSDTPLSTIPSSRYHGQQVRRTRQRGYCRSKFCGIPIWLFWSIILVIILAIVPPVAIIFSRNRKPPKATVLVPLYLYPDPGAWDPLFTALSSNPKTNFTIIINPNSGPGGPELDANYTRDIPRLNSYPNVRTVGYVSTNYTNRDTSLINGDINTYVTWSQNTTTKNLGMKGIFLDETPSEWNISNETFYNRIANTIRSANGLGDDPLIIHNPGTIPDTQYLTSPSSNVTVVFEGSYATYQQYASSKAISTVRKQAKVSRETLAAIVYDFPDELEDRKFLRTLRKTVGNVFLTGSGVDGDVYAGFWSRWQNWVREMGTS